MFCWCTLLYEKAQGTSKYFFLLVCSVRCSREQEINGNLTQRSVGKATETGAEMQECTIAKANLEWSSNNFFVLFSAVDIMNIAWDIKRLSAARCSFFSLPFAALTFNAVRKSIYIFIYYREEQTWKRNPLLKGFWWYFSFAWIAFNLLQLLFCSAALDVA